jgi:hypothetical protein
MEFQIYQGTWLSACICRGLVLDGILQTPRQPDCEVAKFLAKSHANPEILIPDPAILDSSAMKICFFLFDNVDNVSYVEAGRWTWSLT